MPGSTPNLTQMLSTVAPPPLRTPISVGGHWGSTNQLPLGVSQQQPPVIHFPVAPPPLYSFEEEPALYEVQHFTPSQGWLIA
jgi:hypothetical protein